ncbi:MULTISPECIES: GNAT family N-acetyltransferase [unclassified Arthrobacter]|uniref:GNAT family N-acetyltransferase n=1 Tax=unclassified Arthrobacter TaxID=235627 RepID=UPI001E44AD8C|nr:MULTISPECIES: GNAT family N-acetyltransferase [unclassified Arthrobacter]MCC9145266.1 GNAT family N-acetyltransferase [Arthrobacter sp. zg-Y919]MDK1276494.1 GNAT family N-acetyltransferase [Arthrobacter sp. zg.Y919]WIB01911.1 GNAT family N-acetyltransferase [Arthrobacter sp. zg-Y919]
MTDFRLAWLTTPEMVDSRLQVQLRRCWYEVANAGGAVGFPFLPVPEEQVLSAVDSLVRSLGEPENRLLVATVERRLAGWLLLAGNAGALTAHWARISRLQTALPFRGAGIGRALMSEAARAAAEDFGLEQLHLEARGGVGLEDFYRSSGWQEVGRRRDALRLPGGDRDEVLMSLSLTS